jgi:hypothetical protein
MNRIITKPHHMVDIITSIGAGTEKMEPTSDYGHDLHIVFQKVYENKDVTLVLETGIDDICKPCKHNVNGKCDDTMGPSSPTSKGEYNMLLDTRWYEKLKLKNGDSISLEDFCRKVKGCLDEMKNVYIEKPEYFVKEKRGKLEKGIEKLLNKMGTATI